MMNLYISIQKTDLATTTTTTTSTTTTTTTATSTTTTRTTTTTTNNNNHQQQPPQQQQTKTNKQTNKQTSKQTNERTNKQTNKQTMRCSIRNNYRKHVSLKKLPAELETPLFFFGVLLHFFRLNHALKSPTEKQRKNPNVLFVRPTKRPLFYGVGGGQFGQPKIE